MEVNTAKIRQWTLVWVCTKIRNKPWRKCNSITESNRQPSLTRNQISWSMLMKKERVC